MKRRKYVHRFQVNASLKDVAAFHVRASGMAVLTPPPLIVQMRSAPELVTDNTVLEFTLWLGPLPVHWRARIDQVSMHGFRDTQLTGPYAAWVHRHSFRSLGPHRTEILDEIEAVLPTQFPQRMIALGMWINLPILFAFRTWKTRRLLHRAEIAAQPGP